MKIFDFAVMAGLSLVALSCNKNGNVDVPENEVEEVEEVEEVVEPEVFVPAGPRTPVAMTKSMQEVNDKSIDFSLSLFSKIASENKGSNLALSPFSIAAALSMAEQGAVGQTKEEMKEALGLKDLEEKDVRSYYETMADALVKADASVDFILANSAWTKNYIELVPEYQQTLANSFKADIFQLKNYVDINNWCREKTKGKITDLVDAGVNSALLVLVNALYFKGNWADPFISKANKNADFTNYDGSIVRTTFMNKTMETVAYKDDAVRAMSLHFGNYAFALTLIRPEEDVDDIVNKLDGQYLTSILSETKEYMVNLSLPKLSIETSLMNEIKTALASMGMNLAFTQSADFSGITKSADLMISDIGHKVKFSLNEDGAEGAAGTDILFPIGANIGGEKPETLDIKLDKPFIYAITEYSTGAILFIGIQNKF